MSDRNKTDEECCWSPLDSACFVMERAKHVSINLLALQKVTSQVSMCCSLFLIRLFNESIFIKISSATMDGECSSDNWIGSDVDPLKGDIQSKIDWFLFSLNKFFCLEREFSSFHDILTTPLHFSFWTDDQAGTYVRVYKNKRYHDYEALCVANNQAIDVKTLILFSIGLLSLYE